MNIVIARDDPSDVRIYGTVIIDGEKLCDSLELPDRGNHPETSCCPESEDYTASVRWSNRHKHAVLGIDGVPGRDGLAFDVANFPGQLLGCVAVGLSRGMLAGREAILSSGVAMKMLMKKVGCPDYADLLTPEEVADFLAEHSECLNIPLTIKSA